MDADKIAEEEEQQAAMHKAISVVAHEAGRLISEFGRKVHFREFRDEHEMAQAVAEIVRVTIHGTLEAVEGMVVERVHFDA